MSPLNDPNFWLGSACGIGAVILLSALLTYGWALYSYLFK